MKADYETEQIREWDGDFGREYTDRNTLAPVDLDASWQSKYGATRTSLNRKFLEMVPRDSRILEVGCNVGNQLLLLQDMGYTTLHGIDVQSYAVRLASTRVPQARIIEGSALEIPFPDRHFDLVMTSGLLIHIAPADLAKALNEIHRVAKTWILGCEYYAPALTEVNYRGHDNLLWKDNFANRYLQQFPDLRLLREERLAYLNSPNTDTMFILQRDL